MHSHGAVVVGGSKYSRFGVFPVTASALQTASALHVFCEARALVFQRECEVIGSFCLAHLRTHGICKSPTCLKVMHACAHDGTKHAAVTLFNMD